MSLIVVSKIHTIVTNISGLPHMDHKGWPQNQLAKYTLYIGHGVADSDRVVDVAVAVHTAPIPHLGLDSAHPR